MRAEIEALKNVAKIINRSPEASAVAAVGPDFAAEASHVTAPVRMYTGMRYAAALPPKSPSTRIAMQSSSSSSAAAAAAAAAIPAAAVHPTRPRTGGPSPKRSTPIAASANQDSVYNSPISNTIGRPSTAHDALRTTGRVAITHRMSPTAAAFASPVNPIGHMSSSSPLRARPSSSLNNVPPAALVHRPASSQSNFRSSSRSRSRGDGAAGGGRSASAVSREGAAGYASSHDLRCACGRKTRRAS